LCGLLLMLDTLPGDFAVTAVVGPFSKNVDLIGDTASKCRRDIFLAKAPESLYQIMVNCELALTAAGQTAYELAALGTPMVLFAIADNQIRGLEGFSQSGLCTVECSPSDSDFFLRVAQTSQELLKNASLRQHLGLLEKSLVDGRGAFRVTDAIRNANRYSN
jgi:UDP-2,4-diacetamido-2,4,6-trideoxy-beta-L-altropyranose hydrolase